MVKEANTSPISAKKNIDTFDETNKSKTSQETVNKSRSYPETIDNSMSTPKTILSNKSNQI